jgi:hypothetical protein
VKAEVQRRALLRAAESGGALQRAELAALGISGDAAERAVAAGRWTHLARGWYVPRPGPLTPLALARAAGVYAGIDCVVSGLVVLHELGLPWLPRVECAHLLVPDAVRRRSSARVRLTRTTAWPLAGTWLRSGLQIAPVERAVVDAARWAVSLQDARGIVLGAVGQGCQPADLRAVLDAGQRNGSGQTRRAIDDAVRGCASPREAELVDGRTGRGQRFLVNPELRVNGVRLGFPDIWLLDLNVGGEVESREWHAGEEREESTYDRHERFAAAHVELVHLSVARVRRDASAAADHLLARAADRRAAAPVGLTVHARGPVLT